MYPANVNFSCKKSMGTLSGALRIILNAPAEKGCGIPADLPAISGVRTLNNLRTSSRANHQHHRDLVNIQPACSALVIHPHLLRACTVKHSQAWSQLCVLFISATSPSPASFHGYVEDVSYTDIHTPSSICTYGMYLCTGNII